jgi:hypothetical protein
VHQWKYGEGEGEEEVEERRKMERERERKKRPAPPFNPVLHPPLGGSVANFLSQEILVYVIS